MRRRRTRWSAAAASAWIQSSAGGSYCFGAYSAALKASQGYDQSTLNAVSFFKDVGANVGVLSGALASSAAARRRPWLVLLAGAAQCTAGYLPIWLAVAGATPRPPVAAMCLYMLVAAHAQTFFNTANVVTAVENFPDRRGTVIGIMKGFLGLSGAILVQIYRTVFGGNPSSFILMLAILPTSLTLLLMFFVEVYPENKEYNKKFLDAFSLIALLVAGYLMFIIIGECIFTLGSSARTVTLAILLLLLLSPLVIVVKAEKMESEKPEECEQLLAESTSMNKPPFNRELEPSNQDVARILSTENPNLLEAMCTFNFWLLFLAMACGMGSGLATVNNIGQIGGSLGYTSVETGTLVSLWSIWNFIGRFGAGYTSDHFLRSKSMGRPLFISLTLLTMSVGHLIISSGLPGSLYAGSVLVGLCYGCQWSLMPSITSEIFGLRHFGTIFNTVAIASPFGSYILSVRVVGYIYDRESSGHHACMGKHCFMLSFLIMACVCVLGSAVAFALFYRTRRFYKQVIYPRLQSMLLE
ncbi:protein NUCLEAR FUSION DEFECTIVE 4-like [Ananas comosus]|uniref:Protein NUCLEAR FUSION DEFECTIVE 4-like n=2 Tax=Ananas comosus TaxID=4615 RepID=A0A6P5FAH7_ANACO|nr:protein NUCLEAR FUSION DEFECTIVE 4-like [Ananas comosus]